VDTTPENQVLALAGLAQAAELVKQTARRGSCDEPALAALVLSLVKVDAEDVPDVYGGLKGLTLGLEVLARQLGETHRIDRETARYAANLLTLEPLVMARPDFVATLSESILTVETLQSGGGRPLDPRVFQVFATAYQATASRLSPRIMVVGDSRRLADPQNADRVRTLLLAGIRSARLFRQAGGSRWRLILGRNRFRRLALSLLGEAQRVSRNEDT
jgi:high frequency lysogenization protein